MKNKVWAVWGPLRLEGPGPLDKTVLGIIYLIRRSDSSPELSAWRVTSRCVASWGMLGEPAAAAAEVDR